MASLTRKKILRAFNEHCVYCDKIFDNTPLECVGKLKENHGSADHLIPITRVDRKRHIRVFTCVASCYKCNISKSDTDILIFGLMIDRIDRALALVDLSLKMSDMHISNSQSLDLSKTYVRAKQQKLILAKSIQNIMSFPMKTELLRKRYQSFRQKPSLSYPQLSDRYKPLASEPPHIVIWPLLQWIPNPTDFRPECERYLCLLTHKIPHDHHRSCETP